MVGLSSVDLARAAELSPLRRQLGASVANEMVPYEIGRPALSWRGISRMERN